MERHFERDLEELKQRLLWMGSLAERAVHQAVHAVLDAEEHLAEIVLSEEDAINEMQIEIDERVQRLLALQQPMAADLRFLLAVSRINGDLERIGDQAVNIAQSAMRVLDDDVVTERRPAGDEQIDGLIFAIAHHLLAVQMPVQPRGRHDAATRSSNAFG